MKASLLTLLVSAIFIPGIASAAETPPGDYQNLYAELLLQYTRAVDAEVGTRVDYEGLRGEKRWRQLVSRLGAIRPEGLLLRQERLAFWINAYNILVIDRVVENDPRRSIRDIGSFFRSVWKMDAGEIGGRIYSLDEIEHEILRPMGEPRIHAAIVCASISCPNLSRAPYRAARLEADLDAASEAWLRRPEKGLFIDREERVVRISPIFDWFDDDFGGSGGVVEFLIRHAPQSEARWLRENIGNFRIRYFDYNWDLNR